MSHTRCWPCLQLPFHYTGRDGWLGLRVRFSCFRLLLRIAPTSTIVLRRTMSLGAVHSPAVLPRPRKRISARGPSSLPRPFRDGGRLIIAAIVTGILSGIGAIAFHHLADTLGDFLFAWADAHRPMGRVPVVLIIPTVGLGLIGLILQLVPQGRIGGVKEVFESLKHSHGIVPFSRVINVLLSGLVLAFGGSAGPEGPMVQMGALIGSLVGQSTGISGGRLKTIVRAGAAAGIAAAFRSPAGGVLLVLEIFGARFNGALTHIGIAAVIGYGIRTAIVGDAYPFRPSLALGNLPALGLLLLAPLMGLLAAPTGHFFIWMFNRFKTLLPCRWSLALRTALGGLMLGAIAVWFPQVLSAGYPVIKDSLQGGMVFHVFLILLCLKMVATSITFGSGAVGGLFAPTLVIGAMFGGAFGYGFHSLMPAVAPQPELFVLLGMIVMFGSIVKGYWSGLLMVADMSGCYHQLLLPGIIAGGISFLISWKLHDHSIFGLPIDPARRQSGAA